jgi:FLVCR family MFS transporter
LSNFANTAGAGAGYLLIPWQVHRFGMATMLSTWAVVSGVLLALCAAHFPDRPPSPPSRSASMPHGAWLADVRELLRNRDFLLLALATGLPCGVWTGLSGLLPLLLKAEPWHMSDSLAARGMLRSSAWLGFFATIAAVAGGVAAGGAASALGWASYQRALGVLFGTSALLYALFVLVAGGWVGGGAGALYASLVTATAAVNATTALGIELAVDLTFPVGPGATNTLLMMVVNVAQLVFLCFSLADNLLWAMPASCAVACATLLAVKGEGMRQKADRGKPLLTTAESESYKIPEDGQAAKK